MGRKYQMGDVIPYQGRVVSVCTDIAEMRWRLSELEATHKKKNFSAVHISGVWYIVLSFTM